MIGSGTPVELRSGDKTYSVHAAAVTEGWQEILAAYVAKYQKDYPEIVAGFPTIDEAEELMAVFRLHAA